MIINKVLKRIQREVSETALKTIETVAQPLAHSVQRNHSLQPLGVSDSELNSIHKSLSWFNKINYGFWQMDRSRLGILISLAKACSKLEGEFAECGVYQGKSAQLLFNFKSPDKVLHLFDTFEGFTSEDRELEISHGMGRDPGRGHVNTSLSKVKEEVCQPLPGRTVDSNSESLVIHPGKVQDTLPELNDARFSFVHLDMDLYAPMKFAINVFKDKMVKGGVLLLHDYAVGDDGYHGVATAVEEVDMPGFLGPIVVGDQSSAMFICIEETGL